jgi:hypothetical protein
MDINVGKDEQQAIQKIPVVLGRHPWISRGTRE